MKISLTILVVAYSVLGFSGASLAEGIPGGIVFSDGTQILYYDFATEQSQSLTADLKTKIKGPAAISSNGRLLVWVQDTPSGSIFQNRTMPNGKPSPVPTRKNYVKSGPKKNNLCDIPEFLPAIPKTLLVSDTNKAFIYDLRAKPILYVNPAEADASIRASLPSQFGPPKLLKETNLTVWSTIRTSGDVTYHCMVLGSPRFWEEKSPCFPALSIDGRRLAYIDQINGVFGPIYANGGVTARNDRSIKIERTNVSLKNCDGLAWRMDGTLTYLSEGKVCSVAGVVFAQGIYGTNLCWVSDNTLLYRDESGYFSKWESGVITKMIIRVPTGFSYCWKSPFSDSEEDLLDPSKEKATSGKTEFRWGAESTIKIGNIHIPWMPSKNGDYVSISLRKLEGQKPLTLAKTTETELDAIKDPSQCDFSESEKMIAKFSGTMNTAKFRIIKNQVFVVKSGNRYAIVKMISLNSNLSAVFEWKYLPANGSENSIAQGDRK